MPKNAFWGCNLHPTAIKTGHASHPGHVLTDLFLLKPALQAFCGLLGGRDQVLTHLAVLKPALQA